MEKGISRSLENVQIKGNLTVVPDGGSLLDYDGSIEASGTLYVNNITGYDPTEDLIIQSAIFANDTIFIPHSAQSTGSTGALILSGGLSITTTSDAENRSVGGSITTLGGVSIGKSLYVGGPSYFLQGADMSNYKITSLSTPTLATDAANKEYVDLVAGRVSGDFSPGEIIFGLGEGEGVLGSPYLKFNSTIGQLSIGSGSSGGLFIESYEPNSILSFGGMDLYGPSILRNGLNMSSTGITNLAEPVNPRDATTKSYVDTFTGDIRGTFGSSQIIFGFTENAPGTGSVIGSDQLLFYASSGTLFLGSEGNLVISNTGPNALTVDGESQFKGDTSFLYGNTSFLYGNTSFLYGDSSFIDSNVTIDGGVMSILTSTPATGLGSGGVLTISGGMSIYDKLWIGEGLDMNMTRITSVDMPLQAFDAVNKAYVDQLDVFGILSTEFDYKIPLDNGVTTGTALIDIQYPNDTCKAFYSYGYVYQNTDNYGLFMMLGVYSPNKGWRLSQYHIGNDITMEFGIETDSVSGTLTYINPSTIGFANLRYKNAVIIKTVESSIQTEYTLLPSPGIFSDITPQIIYLNTEAIGFVTYIYALDTVTERASFWVINGLLSRNNTWLIHSRQVGDTDIVTFGVRSTGTEGILQYRSDHSLWIKVQNFEISRENYLHILPADTFIYSDVLDASDPGEVPQKLLEIGNDGFKTKFLTIYVEIPDTNQYIIYYITVFLDYDRWVYSSQFIGDNVPEISFRIRNASGGLGILQFKNELQYDAYLRYSTDVAAPVFTPLPVTKGGTGVTELLRDAVLRGNGTDPIIGTEDFVYRNRTVILGDESSILIRNTTEAINLTTGGTFTTLGGVSINKNLLVGDSLIVKSVDITPSLGDITAERFFSAANGQLVPVNVVGFDFTNPAIKAFLGITSVTVTTILDQFDTLYEFRGIRKKDGWVMNTSFIGDTQDFVFTITPEGQVQYTGSAILNWVSTIMKFKAMTTTLF
jgi:hypothetical protein